ncbi:dicentracin-like [Thalassophryne amazonica]|uniref:dicentracin-like n=1 Tax=Thalassophryne amazonica TaxID=390379 RepID=UPI001471B3C1|nr:dicentracin-like [Thalassophryne amazonica]
MKCFMIFLVLTLVVLMAEPGEGFFGRLKAMFRGMKTGWKGYTKKRDYEKMERRYGPNWRNDQGNNQQPSPMDYQQPPVNDPLAAPYNGR